MHTKACFLPTALNGAPARFGWQRKQLNGCFLFVSFRFLPSFPQVTTAPPSDQRKTIGPVGQWGWPSGLTPPCEMHLYKKWNRQTLRTFFTYTNSLNHSFYYCKLCLWCFMLLCLCFNDSKDASLSCLTMLMICNLFMCCWYAQWVLVGLYVCIWF
jgi:hypothetical protein